MLYWLAWFKVVWSANVGALRGAMLEGVGEGWTALALRACAAAALLIHVFSDLVLLLVYNSQNTTAYDGV